MGPFARKSVGYGVISVVIALLVIMAWPRMAVEPQHSLNRLAYPWFEPPESIYEPIQPIPLDLKLDAQVVSLGERLFRDPRLSGRGNLSCASCHDLGQAGADGRARSLDIDGSDALVNTPTVLNSAFNYLHTWNGRFTSLEGQAIAAVKNPTRMGGSWPKIVTRLRDDKKVVVWFNDIYSDGITKTNIARALAEFQRSLTTPDSPFDQYLRGKKSAISEDATAGYYLFKNYGCASCHQGVNLGGNLMTRLGIYADYFDSASSPTKADQGRFVVTKNSRDLHVFRVPSLRNVAQTAPYFHDGSVPELADAVKLMGRYQLGRDIPDVEVLLITGFLETLNGSLPGKSQ